MILGIFTPIWGKLSSLISVSLYYLSTGFKPPRSCSLSANSCEEFAFAQSMMFIETSAKTRSLSLWMEIEGASLIWLHMIRSHKTPFRGPSFNLWLCWFQERLQVWGLIYRMILYTWYVLYTVLVYIYHIVSMYSMLKRCDSSFLSKTSGTWDWWLLHRVSVHVCHATAAQRISQHFPKIFWFIITTLKVAATYTYIEYSYYTLSTYVDVLSWLFEKFIHSHVKRFVWKGSIQMGSAKPIKRPCRPSSTTNVIVSKSSMLRRWALTLTVTWWKSSQGLSPLARILKKFYLIWSILYQLVLGSLSIKSSFSKGRIWDLQQKKLVQYIVFTREESTLPDQTCRLLESGMYSYNLAAFWCKVKWDIYSNLFISMF